MSSPVTEGGLNQTLAFSHSTIHSNKCRDEGKPSLNDVGGMDVEKRTLLEVLVWPTKHKKVYESYGICSGRGILLHGPSGCGKTLLAKAVVAHSKINSIFVKGPELLSKFVGSSEGNVRKVFERARASAPCVIIFDEFDSIAPQRGSDSNGVTDRVVNQLLTEMDGVDNLSGVFVIGCSNRIDLIDSALLRPGRFDHILECSMPDKKNRREILRALLRSVSHDPAVSTDELAARTNGWSGADLKALIINAQFDALRRCSVDHEKRSATIRSFNIENVFNDSSPKREPVKERTRVGNRVLLH